MNREKELLFDELYEKTKDCGRVQFINLLMEKERENQELKEQLENEQNYSQSVFSDFQDYKEEASAYLDKIENQQKDFIEYLESEINLFEKYMKNIERSDRPHGDYPITYWSSKYRLNEVAEILSKYKEIIGNIYESDIKNEESI